MNGLFHGSQTEILKLHGRRKEKEKKKKSRGGKRKAYAPIAEGSGVSGVESAKDVINNVFDNQEK